MSVAGLPTCCGALVMSSDMGYAGGNEYMASDLTAKAHKAMNGYYGVVLVSILNPEKETHDKLLELGWVHTMTWKGQYEKGYRVPYINNGSNGYPMMMYALTRKEWVPHPDEPWTVSPAQLAVKKDVAIAAPIKEELAPIKEELAPMDVV